MKEALSAGSRSTPIVGFDSGCDQSGPAKQLGRIWSQPFPARQPSCSLIRAAGDVWCLLCLGICLCAIGCRRTAPAALDSQQNLGEGPEQYSALVVRTVEQDGGKDTVESRITVSGQMIREDWAEHGEKRALIVRPDLGESYLLFLDKGEYVVQALDRDTQFFGSGGSRSAHQGDAGSELPAGDSSEAPLDPIAIESDLSPSALPGGISNIALPDATIDNHPCKAFERRAVLPSGTTEITRTYKAIDLSGMTIRIESESDGKGGHFRVITERRDIQIGVSPALFDIAAGLRRKAS
jgi:hypothetical protein